MCDTDLKLLISQLALCESAEHLAELKVCSVNIVLACLFKDLINIWSFIISAGFHAGCPYRPGFSQLSLFWPPLS